MKKLIRYAACLMAVALACCTLAACGGDDDDDDDPGSGSGSSTTDVSTTTDKSEKSLAQVIIGAWYWNNYEYVFCADGSGEMDVVIDGVVQDRTFYTWDVNEKTQEVVMNFETGVYYDNTDQWKIDAIYQNYLLLRRWDSDDYPDSQDTFYRVEPAAGVPTTIDNSSKSLEQMLIGTWDLQGDEYVFYADGSGELDIFIDGVLRSRYFYTWTLNAKTKEVFMAEPDDGETYQWKIDAIYQNYLLVREWNDGDEEYRSRQDIYYRVK